jgi:hypothetical protein
MARRQVCNSFESLAFLGLKVIANQVRKSVSHSQMMPIQAITTHPALAGKNQVKKAREKPFLWHGNSLSAGSIFL